MPRSLTPEADEKMLRSARLAVAAGDVQLYLARLGGESSEMCLFVVVDAVAAGVEGGGVCPVDRRGLSNGLGSATLLTAREPCDLIGIIVPDGYRSAPLQPPSRVVGTGSNAVLVTATAGQVLELTAEDEPPITVARPDSRC